MRILHFADLHIGVENYGRVDPATGMSTRVVDFLTALDELVEYALSQDVDLVLLAGDAYKGRDPSQTHQRELAKRLAQLSSAGVPVFMLVGNHDLPHAVGRATAVEIFRTLSVPNLIVGDQLQNYTVSTKNGPLQIVAVPWPRRSGFLNREDSRGMTILQIREVLEDRLARGIQACVEQLDPDVPALLAGHLTINGAKTGTEQSMMLGQDHILFPSAVQKPQLDYIALGHLHKHQVLRQNPMLVYSGSLQRVDFSEERDVKGFCVVDLDPSAPQGQRLQNFHFQKVDARPFLTIDVKVDPGEMEPTHAVIRDIVRHKISDSIVRVKIALPSELNIHLRESEIRQALSSAHYVAAVTREVEQDKRTRISADQAEGLMPLDALRVYLESREVDSARKEQLLRYAEELISEELQRE